jgi:hypothetical protein
MPVEVIKALALGGVLLELVPGEMTELMGLTSALRCPIYRQLLARLKQAAYQEPSGTREPVFTVPGLGVLVDDNA